MKCFARQYRESMLYVIPILTIEVPDLLEKGDVQVKPYSPDLGHWQGLKIIAIGPKGGKIVGYTKGQHKPIYAGSSKAHALAGMHGESPEGEEKDKKLATWLLHLDIDGVMTPTSVKVSAEDAQHLKAAFGVSSKPVAGGMHEIPKDEIVAHYGKSHWPKYEHRVTHAADIAAGDDEGVFPELTSLKQVHAGKFAGSHGNKVFVDGEGKKWIFKGEDPTIARAEEAASRIGRLVMGDKLPPSKFVKVSGQDGVLIREIEGEALNENHKSGAAQLTLKKHLKDVAKHAVLDWLISNHDGHSGNFLETAEGLNAIDKGQAWRFFGDDHLNKDYHPNPSPTIYNKFWNMVAEGKLDADKVLQGVQAGIDAVYNNLSIEQFHAIIGPYVATYAGHKGIDGPERASMMTQRLVNLRKDFEHFLGDLLGKPVKLSGEAQQAADLPPGMAPEGPPTAPPVPEPHPPESKNIQDIMALLGMPLKQPEAPEVTDKPIEAPPKVEGWPKTKGTVTIHSPGEPVEPGGKWKTGYPGPGFTAEVGYKGQKFQVQFQKDADGKMLVSMQYPDGTSHTFDSPNGASDSMYLWLNKLPLEMTATEKKAKGISYPATKAFGIKAFEQELSGSLKPGKIPDGAKTVEHLEAEGKVTKDQSTLGLVNTWYSLEHGTILSPEHMPPDLQEFIAAQSKVKVGESWPNLLVPGIAVVVQGIASNPLIISAAVGEDGQPAYHQWFVKTEGGIGHYGPLAFPSTVDHWLSGKEHLKKEKEQHLAQSKGEKETVAQKVGAPPPSIVPSEPTTSPQLLEEPNIDMLQNSDVGTTITYGSKQQFKATKKEANSWHVTEVGDEESEPSHFMDSELHEALSDYHSSGKEAYIKQPLKENKPQVTVPPEAPKTGHPLPPGSNVKVKKKGLGEVQLYALAGGQFNVVMADGTEKLFGSLSAACDHVWVKQQGFADAEAYKKAKGVNKVPSGGGWKFWGINPAKPATPVAAGESPKTVTHPSEGISPTLDDWTKQQWEEFPTKLTKVDKEKFKGAAAHGFFTSAPAGTVINLVDDQFKETLFTKGTSGYWHSSHGTVMMNDQLRSLAMSPLTEEMHAQKGESVAPEISAWDTHAGKGIKVLSKLTDATSFFAMAPDSAVIGVHKLESEKSDAITYYKKVSSGEFGVWKPLTGGDAISNSEMSLMPEVISMSIQSPEKKQLSEATPPVWHPWDAKMIATLTQEHLDSQPVGTQYKVTVPGVPPNQILTKKLDGTWHSTSGGVLSADDLSTVIQHHKDEAEVSAPLQGGKPGEPYLKPTKSEAQAVQGWVSVDKTTIKMVYLDAEVGDTLKLTSKYGDTTEDVEVTKQADGTWLGPTTAVLTPEDLGKILDSESTVQVQKPILAETEPEPEPGEFQKVEYGDISTMPVKEVGSTVTWGDKKFHATKVSDEKWEIVDEDGDVVDTASEDMLFSQMHKEALKPGGGVYLKTKAKKKAAGEWVPSTIWSPNMNKDTAKEALHAAPIGHKIKYTYDDGSWTVYTKVEGNTWEGEHSDGSEAATKDANTLGYLTGHVASIEVAPAGAEEKAPEEPAAKPVVSKIGKPILDHTGFPSAIGNKLKYVFDSGLKWSDQPSNPDDPASPKAGAKPATWAPWVPPTGVVYEGEHQGKKFWTVVHVSGHGSDGAPGKEMGFAIIDEEGHIYPGKSSAGKPGAALVAAAKKAGMPNDLKVLKKMFGFDKTIFAPGETFKSIKEGTGPTAIPPAPLKPKPVEEMTPEEQAEPVKKEVPISEALKTHDLAKELGSKFVVKASNKAGHTNICVNKHPEAYAKLMKLMQEFGLAGKITNVGGVPHKAYGGAFITVPTSLLNEQTVTVTEAATAAKLHGGTSLEDWKAAGFPEDMPQVWNASHKDSLSDMLLQIPLGAVIHLPLSGSKFKCTDYGMFEHETAGGNKSVEAHPSVFNQIYVNMNAHGGEAHVYPPGADVGAGVAPKPKPKPKPKPVAKSAEQIAKEAKQKEAIEKAKAIGAWSKEHQHVTDDDTLKALSYMQDALGGSKFVAKTKGDDLVIGPVDALPGYEKLAQFQNLETADSPMGKMLVMPKKKVHSFLPKMIKGPDNKKYPAGTTFETEEIKHTIEEVMKEEPGFHKWKEHDKEPNTMVLKVSGTGEEQKQQLAAMLNKYGVKWNGTPVVGGSNVLGFVPKSELEKVAKTTTKTTPKIPPQPKPFTAMSLPGVGSIKAWDVATSDAGQLGAVAGMKLPVYGHPILMGKPGILRDSQVNVRKVKAADGKFYYEVRGQLSDFNPKKSTLVAGQFKIPSSMTKALTLHSGTTEKHINYNADEGYCDETGTGASKLGEGLAVAMGGYTGATDNGSAVQVVHAENPTFNDFFTVRIPEDQDLHTELAGAFQKLGYKPEQAMAPLDADSERVFKKMNIVRAYMGAEGWHHAMTHPKQMHDEEWLDSQMKELKVPEGLVDSAEIRHTAQGNISVVLKDAKKFKEAGWRYAYRSDKESDAIFHQLFDGAGYASRKFAMMNGVNPSGSGQSASADIMTGGSTGNFFRVGTSSSSGIGTNHIIMHPRVFERADWWHAGHDSWGAIAKTGGHHYDKHFHRNNTSKGTEIMFQNNSAMEDVLCVILNPSDRKLMLNKLAKYGITEIGGRPVEEVILSDSDKAEALIEKTYTEWEPGE